MSLDKSLIRFYTTFAAAKASNEPAIIDASLRYRGFVQLSPDEMYCQRTNLAESADVNNTLTFFLIDCAGNVLLDITELFGVRPLTDDNVVEQFDWEIAPIGIDFHNKELFIKIVNSEDDFEDDPTIFYSNGFLITNDNLNHTSRFDYRSYGFNDLLGINYGLSEGFTYSIRVNGFWNDINDESVSKDYKQITNGNEISVDEQIYEKKVYRAEYHNIETYRLVNRIMGQQIIFIDGVRVTNKPFAKKDERLGQSNIFSSEWECSMNEKETFTPQLQIVGINTGDFLCGDWDSSDWATSCSPTPPPEGRVFNDVFNPVFGGDSEPIEEGVFNETFNNIFN